MLRVPRLLELTKLTNLILRVMFTWFSPEKLYRKVSNLQRNIKFKLWESVKFMLISVTPMLLISCSKLRKHRQQQQVPPKVQSFHNSLTDQLARARVKMSWIENTLFCLYCRLQSLLHLSLCVDEWIIVWKTMKETTVELNWKFTR